MKKRIVTLLLTLLTVLSLLPTVAMAAESTGVGITPVTDPNLWTTRLNSQGQTYSYRPPTAAGRQLYCMDLGYSYRSGTESFLQSYMYRSATGADADALWNDAVAETGLGEMDAITKENVKWMMSYIADYTGEIPGSLFMALQTYIWDNQSDKSAGGDPSGDIDAGGFANADTYDQYVEYYNWLLGQKANEDAEFQRQIEEYAAQGIHASIVEDESSKWAVLATSSVSGRQSFFAYHSGRKVIADDEPQDDDDPPPAGDGDITFQKVIAGTDKGLDGAVYNIYLDGQIVGSDVTSGGGYIEVHDVTEGLWSFVEQEAPAGYALDPTPHSVYVSVTDGDKQYTVTVGDEELPGIKVIKTSAVDGSPVENAVYSIEGVTCAFSTSVSTGPDGSALVEDLPAGVYIVREESVPEPFVRTASEQTIALRPGKISEARFEDYTRPGLEIVKRNIADRSPIEGVTYQVRQIDGDFLDTVETDSSGKAFLEVAPGSYEISEVNVPSNVIISEIPQTIFLEPGVTRTVRFFNAVKPSLTVIKRNSITKDPLENAKFHIYYASDNTETGEINDLGTYYTDSSGRIVLTNVNRGWYKVVEEESPTGFSIQDDGVYEFYLEAGVSRELVVDNTPLSALVVYKYDSATKLPLEGARFELRYLSGETSGTEGTVIGEYVTSKNGSFTVTGLKEGTYICQELESPDGHLIDSEPQTVYISGKEQDVVTLRFGNAPLGSLLITKVSDDEKREPLSDVEFLLTDSSGNFIGTNNGRYVTNSAGEILVEGLTPGTTVVAREVRAKPGYLLDDSPQYALIRSGETVGLEFRNAPAGNLVIVKRSSSGTHEPLEGVEFKITYADGSYVPDENGQLSSNGLYYTDREGKITLSGVVGTIVATETASIPGYTIDEATRTQTVVVHPNDTQTLYVYNEPETTLVLEKFIKGTDREPLAGVEFLVTDGAGTVIGPNNGVYTTGEDGRAVITGLTPGTTITARETQTAEGFVLDGSPQSILIKEGEVQTLTFWNAREGGVELVKVNAADKTERLSDAVFEIRKASDDALVDTVTTGDTGTVFAPLAEGDYYALELESPSGFKLDSTRHYFTVKDGEVTQEVIENEAVSGILLHKVDSATGDGIYGVTFLLYDDTNTPIGQYTSDDRGYVYIEGLESGRFYLRELENEGYIVDTEKKTVYVKSGETTEITWKNTPITGQIQITKTSADYNSMNGWPAGTPIPNTEFEIYNARTGKLVDTIRTDKNGVAVSKPLPLARYEVIESKAADFYGLDKTPIEVEIEYAGQIVKAAMTNKSLYTNVSIKKTGYVEVMPGQTLRYDFTDIANNSTTSLESFYWRERLPAFAHLQKIVTGTWNVPGSYKIVYKTTLSGDTYRVLADNLSTQQNYVLDASPAALGLASGEKATEFMVVFGIVPANFRQVEAPVVYCTASQWLTGGSQIVNQTDVGGIHDGQWIMATSRWATKVYKPAEPLPRTGY
ncbi:SpaA isopeptide-forming pilin-related protein [Dysosmobacter welbionis]|uniref:SpaA isopeptide-forming pilin-related protein n=1 Tax=Dysosmobacter welbionis TaxID=2093857 RepID=UPI00210D5BC5|nr:SpaA isopeptide-forming pilin-related protein [Dysosmobacter welbionis]MCQ5044420.1 SpaA isopeptide-forming pilin-related protein [Dysosmobacter welbionis]